MSFSGCSVSKESACNAGDTGSIPGLGRSPGEGNGYPLQYSCLENPMDRGVDRGAWRATVHGVARSQTWLSDWCTHSSLGPLGWLQPRIRPLLIRPKSHQTCMVLGHWRSEICTQTMKIAVLSWAWENTEVLLPFHKLCLGRGLLYSLDLTWVLLWTSRSLTGSQDKELQEPRLMSQLFSSSLSQFSLFPAQRCFLLAG